ncbi:Uncharacterized protein TCM_018754 [Theobroma cacao]|uniref:Uncharacterized protein n=1 Tax=Theobroma cacao TaxID=3641 RepID=A0A061EFC6_THECC|nr:Uncharacterized protein TCM_018754 [Theobroma cacao]
MVNRWGRICARMFHKDFKIFERKFESLDKAEDGIGKKRRAGDLALLWRKGVIVDVKLYFKSHIDAKIMMRGIRWRMIGFYGALMVSNK